MNIEKIANKIASEFVAGEVFVVTVFSGENGKWYLEDKMFFSPLEKAIKNASHFLDSETSDEGKHLESEYAVVVYKDDTLYGYGGKGFNKQAAMRYGTGTVNRLTKEADKVKTIMGE